MADAANIARGVVQIVDAAAAGNVENMRLVIVVNSSPPGPPPKSIFEVITGAFISMTPLIALAAGITICGLKIHKSSENEKNGLQSSSENVRDGILGFSVNPLCCRRKPARKG